MCAIDDLEKYRVAVARLDALIDPVGPDDRSLAAVWARAAAKLERARSFIAYLGNPRDRFPIVHVTGTSGKGSTCAAIASVLTRAGYRAGLATSPYLQVATEKLQIGPTLIGPGQFADLVDHVLEAAENWRRRAHLDRPLTYGEVWVALMATWFAQQQVDIAIIEVGAGGRFDVTNLVRPLVTVVTSVGLDHTATLGSTIELIAWHKAGIFKPGAAAITAATNPAALSVLREEAHALGVRLTEVDPDRSLTIVDSGRFGTRWRVADNDGPAQSPIYLSRQPGWYQAVNGATALAVVRHLSGHGFSVVERDLELGLAAARMPGRTEQMPVTAPPAVLIDAAHNPDKVRALVSSLPMLFDQRDGDQLRPVLLIGALSGKDAHAMVGYLAPAVSAIVTTAAGVTGKHPLRAEELARVVREAGFSGPVSLHPNPEQALTIAMQLARDLKVPVLTTGSLYLAGRVRERWYRGDDILRQQTPWPDPPPARRTQ